MTEEQKQIIVGTVLGDSTIRKTGKLYEYYNLLVNSSELLDNFRTMFYEENRTFFNSFNALQVSLVIS